MKLARLVVLVGACLTLALATRVTRADGTALPEKRPADVEFSYSWGGGMSGEHAALTLSAKGGTYTTGNAAGNLPDTTLKFTPTAAELDALYETIRQNHLENMPSKPAQILDKGSTHVSVTWAGGTVAHDDGQSELTEEAGQRFGKICHALATIAEKVVAANELDLVVALDEALAKSAHTIWVGKGHIMQPILKSPGEADWSIEEPLARTLLRSVAGKQRLDGRVGGNMLKSVDVDFGASRGLRLSVKDGALVAEAFDPKGSVLHVDPAKAKAQGLPAASIVVDLGDTGLAEVGAAKTGIVCSGPPGGPLVLAFEKYDGTANKSEALVRLATARSGAEGCASSPSEPVGETSRPAVTWVAGSGNARALHLLALFPKAPESDSGILVEFTLGTGAKDVPSPDDVFKLERFGDLLRSVRVRFE